MSEEQDKGLGWTVLDALLAPTNPADRAAWEAQKTRASVERLTEAQREAARATLVAASAAEQSRASSAERLAALEARVEHLEKNLAATALYARTLLQVLVERGGLDAKAFRETFDRLDLLDGVRDGR